MVVDGSNIGRITVPETWRAYVAAHNFSSEVLYCIIVALEIMTRKQSAIATIKALIANPPLLLFAAKR